MALQDETRAYFFLPGLRLFPGFLAGGFFEGVGCWDQVDPML